MSLVIGRPHAPYATASTSDVNHVTKALLSVSVRGLLRHALLLDSLRRTAEAVDAVVGEDTALSVWDGYHSSDFYSLVLEAIDRMFFDAASDDFVHGCLGAALDHVPRMGATSRDVNQHLREQLLRRMNALLIDSFCYEHDDCKESAAISLACAQG